MCRITSVEVNADVIEACRLHFANATAGVRVTCTHLTDARTLRLDIRNRRLVILQMSCGITHVEWAETCSAERGVVRNSQALQRSNPLC